MKKQKESALSNTKIAIVFFIFLVFIVGISLIFKAVAVIRISQFDGSERFTLSISNGRNIEVVSLFPGSKNIAVFKLNDNIKPAEAGRLLEIPVDGFVMFSSLDLNRKIDLLFMDAIYNCSRIKTNLTVIDLIRLAIFAKTIPENSINVKMVEDDASELELDKIVGRLVSDSFIEKDKQTIKIVNGTGVSGLGNRLARLITNMGGDVIIVATSDSLIKKSAILYIDEKTYTVEKLRKILGYDAVREVNNAISDITVVIGEDKVGNLPF